MRMESSQRNTLLWGIGLAFLSVLMGAFGAHLLNSSLSLKGQNLWKTATEYQFFHALTLILLGSVPPTQNFSKITFCFKSGVFLFCGSLYLLSLSPTFEALGAVINFRNNNPPLLSSILSNINKVGIITPLGGLSFLLGWVLWFTDILRSKTRELN